MLNPLTRYLPAGRLDGGPFARSLGGTGRPALIIPASSSWPPMGSGILPASGNMFVGRGVEGDSQPHSLARWLNRLLVRGCWLTPGGWEWLAQGWHHLRSLQHCGLQCLSLPVYSSSQLGGPPHGRLVSRGCRYPWGQRGLLRRYTPSGEIWRGEAWRRHHVSRHTSHGGTRIGYSSGGGGQSIPWSLLASGSTTWGELAERLPYMYSEVSGGNSGDKTLLL